MKLIRTAALVAAATAAYSKAQEYARQNPEKASGHIDKAESFVRGKAGPKYADKVGKGSAALRQTLGLPRGAAAPGASTPGSTVTTPSDTDNGSKPAGTSGFDPAI